MGLVYVFVASIGQGFLDSGRALVRFHLRFPSFYFIRFNLIFSRFSFCVFGHNFSENFWIS